MMVQQRNRWCLITYWPMSSGSCLPAKSGSRTFRRFRGRDHVGGPGPPSQQPFRIPVINTSISINGSLHPGGRWHEFLCFAQPDGRYARRIVKTKGIHGTRISAVISPGVIWAPVLGIRTINVKFWFNQFSREVANRIGQWLGPDNSGIESIEEILILNFCGHLGDGF
jgi:hypothetical protein